MQPIHTEAFKGLTIEIYQDDSAANPYEMFDQAGTLYHWHKRGFTGTSVNDLPDSRITTNKYLRETEGLAVPVYLYEHSGQTISPNPFSCRFGSGQVGVWIMTKEEIIAEFGDDGLRSRAQAIKLMESQIKELDQYLRGEVYGYVLKRAGKQLDSCWGFFGDFETVCLAEAREEATRLEKAERIEKQGRLKQLIRAKVPLIYRENSLSA